MPDIQIAVEGKEARVIGSPEIVCGNSDYTVTFTFDEEWRNYALKTARLRFYIQGILQRRNIAVTGNTIRLPALYDISEVEIGVYAGNIRTTTPARIPCSRCITDGASQHAAPRQDVYDQLLEYLSQLKTGGGGYVAASAKSRISAVSAAIVTETAFRLIENGEG